MTLVSDVHMYSCSEVLSNDSFAWSNILNSYGMDTGIWDHKWIVVLIIYTDDVGSVPYVVASSLILIGASVQVSIVVVGPIISSGRITIIPSVVDAGGINHFKAFQPI